MAFNLMLRRASSSLLIPLATRAAAAGSRRSLCDAAVSAPVSVEKIKKDLMSSSSMNKSIDQLSSDAHMIQEIESEIEGVDQPMDEIPDWLPFKISDNKNKRVSLVRSYQGEIIEVIPHYADEKKSNRRRFHVKISKPNGTNIRFCAVASGSEIEIFFISTTEYSTIDETYFADMNKNLQKAFSKYLEMRGVNVNTVNFAFEYKKKKKIKQYVHWLNDLKKSFQM